MSPLVLLPAVLALTPAFPGETHLDQLRGFRIEVPEGWSTLEQDGGDGSHVLYLVPAAGARNVLVGVSHRALGAGEDTEDLLAASLARIRGEPDRFSELEQGEFELLGRTCPALSVVFDSPQLGPVRIEACFLAEGGNGYTLQRVAPPEQYERWSQDLDAAVATFALIEPSEEGLRLKRLRELAARCGSQVEWAADWDEAARRAREQDRRVLVVMWLYRNFELPLDPRSTVFMDEDVIELVSEHYVPYWYRPGDEAAFVERYGLSPTAFGQALLVVTPEGELVGEMVHATSADAAHAFLLLAHAVPPGAPVPFVDRSSTNDVVVGELTDWESCVLVASLHRVHRRGDDALKVLDRARQLLVTSPSDEGEARRLMELARVQLRMGQSAEARGTCETLLADQPESDQAPAARLQLALLDLQAGERERARERLEALTEADPERPEAWQAAALLLGGVPELDVPLDFAWPDTELLREAVLQPEPDPVPANLARWAREGALAWLLDAQQEDGSWISPTELGDPEDGPPSPFTDAITALAVRGLIAHAGDEKARAAVERGLAFLLASVERRKSAPTPVLYMDYTTWSDGALLETFAAALEAEIGDSDALRAAADEVLEDLAGRAQPHGGWGYYVTARLGATGAPPTSMSFTTAAAVLALARARAAGIQVPEELLEGKGVASLEAMRAEDGVFAYSLQPGGPAGVASGMVPGAVGRSPACELALLRAGASDHERVAHSLEQFLEHADTLAAQQGKGIMHAGAQAQGCHYVLFDYGWAAEAWRAIEGDTRTRVRLLELLLDCRQQDGSFLDTPINGRAYGTAMALLALDALDAAQGRGG